FHRRAWSALSRQPFAEQTTSADVSSVAPILHLLAGDDPVVVDSVLDDPVLVPTAVTATAVTATAVVVPVVARAVLRSAVAGPVLRPGGARQRVGRAGRHGRDVVLHESLVARIRDDDRDPREHDRAGQ